MQNITFKEELKKKIIMALLQAQCVKPLKKNNISFQIFSDNCNENNLDLSKLIKYKRIFHNRSTLYFVILIF